MQRLTVYCAARVFHPGCGGRQTSWCC